MVIFLVGLVTMILMRTLRRDFARYQKEDELDDMVRPHGIFNIPCADWFTKAHGFGLRICYYNLERIGCAEGLLLVLSPPYPFGLPSAGT